MDLQWMFWPVLVLAFTLPESLKAAVQRWANVRLRELEAALKRDMLARGLSVEEMLKVLGPSRSDTDQADDEAAKPAATNASAALPSTGGNDPVVDAKLKLLEKLLDNGMEADGIATVLKATFGEPLADVEKPTERPVAGSPVGDRTPLAVMGLVRAMLLHELDTDDLLKVVQTVSALPAEATPPSPATIRLVTAMLEDERDVDDILRVLQAVGQPSLVEVDLIAEMLTNERDTDEMIRVIQGLKGARPIDLPLETVSNGPG